MEANMLEVLMNRKSVRVYEDRPVEDKKKDQIIEAAIRAATAGNMSLYSIIEIEDQEIKDKLVVSCDNQPFIATAPLALLFLVDYHKWYEVFREKDSKTRRPGHGDLLLGACDALIAAQAAAMAAEALGLGSCYIGDILENAEFHRDLFNLPDFTMPIVMLTIGYPTEHQRNRKQPPRFKREAMVHKDTYKKRELKTLLEDLEKKDPIRGALAQIDDIYNRKWTSDFLEEMNRSVDKWLEWWK
ncbi:MAG: nitroreductase [Tissierellia bacterium]|nr:nitroreductase [Tissierellia bacterium]